MKLFGKKYEKTKNVNVCYGLCVPDKKKTDAVINGEKGGRHGCRNTSKEYKDMYNDDTFIVIDHNDLWEGFCLFKKTFGGRSLKSIWDETKSPNKLRLDQKLAVFKIRRMKANGIKLCLLAAIMRSGKTYIMAGNIIDDSKEKEKCNYLIITTAINETIEQYLKVFDCIELSDFNVKFLRADTKKDVMKSCAKSSKNIICVSKDYLIRGKKKGVIKEEEWLRDLQFDEIYLDEGHKGGCTILSKKMLEYYKNDETFVVIMSGTYKKIIKKYDIPSDSCCFWDQEDIQLLKNPENAENRARLVEKHGKEILNLMTETSTQVIKDTYSKYPELNSLVWDITQKCGQDLGERNSKNSVQGWSLLATFLGNWDLNKLGEGETPNFQDDNAVLHIFNHLFGEHDGRGIVDNDYPIKTVFMEKIKDICKMGGSRSIGDMPNDDPMVIMAFLPQKGIYYISKCTKKLLEEKHL